MLPVTLQQAVYKFGQRRAIAVIAREIKNGILEKVSTKKCVDCGKPAQHYDHRDYNKPLSVEPVCQPCNLLRGAGLCVVSIQRKDIPAIKKIAQQIEDSNIHKKYRRSERLRSKEFHAFQVGWRINQQSMDELVAYLNKSGLSLSEWIELKAYGDFWDVHPYNQIESLETITGEHISNV